MNQPPHPDPQGRQDASTAAPGEPAGDTPQPQPGVAGPSAPLGQHPTTTDDKASPPAAAPGPAAAGPQPPDPKHLKPLAPGEPPPESSAGS